jgi:hypothetical protein
MFSAGLDPKAHSYLDVKKAFDQYYTRESGHKPYDVLSSVHLVRDLLYGQVKCDDYVLLADSEYCSTVVTCAFDSLTVELWIKSQIETHLARDGKTHDWLYKGTIESFPVASLTRLKDKSALKFVYSDARQISFYAALR